MLVHFYSFFFLIRITGKKEAENCPFPRTLSIRAGCSLGWDQLLLGSVLQFCKWSSWPLWLLSCYQVIPSLMGLGRSLLSVCNSGWERCSSPCTGCLGRQQMSPIPAACSPKWQRERSKKKKKSISFSLLQGWGCKAYNLCLFSVFFHCLIIAKYFI